MGKSIVLEAIRNIEGNLSTTEKSLLFISHEYKASNGKTNPEYLLTRDGFSLVVFGFNGAEALQWKLKYIEAFNKMEEAIRNKQHLPTEPMDLLKLAFQALEQQAEKINHITKRLEALEKIGGQLWIHSYV